MKLKLKNKKTLLSLTSIVLLLMLVIGVMIVNRETVLATNENLAELISPPTALAKANDRCDIKIKYIFSNGSKFKEEIIQAKKDEVLDSGDLPMLPNDMIFSDNFLFYKVKGDGSDEIIRTVEKVVKDNEEKKEKDKEEQTGKDKSTQTEDVNKNASTQTDIVKSDLDKKDKELKDLKENIEKIDRELKDKDKLSEKQKDTIKSLEAEIGSLNKKLREDKKNIDSSSEDLSYKKSIEELEKKAKLLQDTLNALNKKENNSNADVKKVIPNTNEAFGSFSTSPIKTEKRGNAPTTTSSTGIPSEKKIETKVGSNNTKAREKSDEKEVRYPNKLTAKASSSSENTSSMDNAKPINTNKGVASSPSKARASVTENKDNANKDYPIHHGDEKDDKSKEMYSADARQFLSFKTKNGKEFHLIVNHDEKNENVMLLTEVSEDDLLNMTEKQEVQKEPIKEESVKEEVKPVKQKESSNTSMYFIVILVVIIALGLGYYFKVVKKKENVELENFEEDDEDFFSEADENENEDASNSLEETGEE